jgi:hypothetical protein
VEKQDLRDVMRALSTLSASPRQAALDVLMTVREAIAAGHITVTRRDGYLW